MRKTLTVLIVLLPVILLVGCGSTGQIAQSHLDANIPEEPDFDSFLKRDLMQYFANNGKAIAKVKYELLRDQPTQTGIAYPKYYAWVRVSTSEGNVSQGAARIAAIEKGRFEITDFLDKERIAAAPKIIEAVFPGALREKILEKAR